MATNILMPALSPTMTEGTLTRWLKKEGDEIVAGDVIAEIETDKATMEYEAVDEGILGKILIGDGTENVPVNEPIGIIVEEGEEVPSEPPPSPAPPKPSGEQEAPKAEPPKSEPPKSQPSKSQPSKSQPSRSGPAKAEAQKSQAKSADAKQGGTGGDLPPLEPAQPGELYDSKGERIFVSPLARRMAKQAGLDLANLKGSGPHGRIVRADVEAAAAKGAPAAKPEAEAKPTAAAAPPAAAAPAAPAASEITAPHEKLPLSNMRKVIARRLLQSTQTVPHFYLSMDIEIDALLKLRADLNAQAPKEGAGAFKLSVNDLLIKASAIALRRVPAANSSYTEDAIIRYTDVDISVAVAIEEGLITPIIRRADQKGLAAISNEMKDLATRAKSGKLKPEEFQGGSFSISNLGMYGISSFSAIINPPQGAIMAVGTGEKRAVVREDRIVTRTMMTVTLSSDHRVVDGAVGAEFLAAFKAIVEQPLSLML